MRMVQGETFAGLALRAPKSLARILEWTQSIRRNAGNLFSRYTESAFVRPAKATVCWAMKSEHEEEFVHRFNHREERNYSLSSKRRHTANVE